jgi:hypothetical protein
MIPQSELKQAEGLGYVESTEVERTSPLIV